MNYEAKIPVATLATADVIEEGSYTRKLTEDERKTVQATIVHITHEEGVLDDQRKESAKSFKEAKKDMTTRKKDMLRQDRTGEVTEVDQLSTFFDQDSGTAHIYNSKGELVRSRAMTYDERQTQIPGIVKMKADSKAA